MVLGGPQLTAFCTHLCQNLDEKGGACVLPVISVGVKYQQISWLLTNSWVRRDAVTTRQKLRILLSYKIYIHLTNLTPEFSIYLQDLRKILNIFSTTGKLQGLYVNSYLIPPNKNIETEVILLQGALWIFSSQEVTVNASLIKGCGVKEWPWNTSSKFWHRNAQGR